MISFLLQSPLCISISRNLSMLQSFRIFVFCHIAYSKTHKPRKILLSTQNGWKSAANNGVTNLKN